VRSEQSPSYSHQSRAHQGRYRRVFTQNLFRIYLPRRLSITNNQPTTKILTRPPKGLERDHKSLFYPNTRQKILRMAEKGYSIGQEAFYWRKTSDEGPKYSGIP